MILTLLLYIIRTLGNQVQQKHIIMNRLLLGVVLLLCSLLTFGQAPGAMSFQAVARDTEGNPLSEKTVSFKIEIVQGSEDGTVAYAETHRVKTAKNGVVNLQIGMGTNTVGTFSAIDWSHSPYFLCVSMDDEGGSDYTEVSTTQMLSVPYALYAERAGNVKEEEEKEEIPDFLLVPQQGTDAELFSGLKPKLSTSSDINTFVFYPNGEDQQVECIVESTQSGIDIQWNDYSNTASGPYGRYLAFSFSVDENVGNGNYDCILHLKNKYGITKSFPFTLEIEKLVDDEPDDEISPDTFWQSDEDVRAALTGIIGQYQPYKIMNEAIDDAFMSKEETAEGEYAEFTLKTYSAISPSIEKLYADAYAVINACNILIEGVTNTTSDQITETVKTNAVKQAKAIRAYAHLMLTEWFERVPLVMKRLDTSEAFTITQSARQEILTAVISDLQDAKDVTHLFEENGEMTAEEVQLLLMEAQLLKGDYQSIQIEAEEGISTFVKKVADWLQNKTEEVTEATLIEEYMNNFQQTYHRGNLYLNVLEYSTTYFGKARYALLPIPQSEIHKNPNIVQNPYW